MRRDSFALTAGTFVLLLTHLLFLRQAGGFHFDEAWAALFAHRIATEPGFWPIQAMSPYASAWGHYGSALFFRVFGTSLLVFRMSGMAWVFAGIGLMMLALRRMGETRAAWVLPFVIAFAPALVLNHRFAIEINTFHVFCFGLLAYGLTGMQKAAPPRGSLACVALASLLGVTSHLLFMAPVLAAFTLASFDDETPMPPRVRALLALVLAVFFLFFLKIHWAIPEKDKSLALLLVTGACVLPLILPRFASMVPIPFVRLGTWISLLLLIPAGLFLAFFWEGSWSEAYFAGGLPDPRWIGLSFVGPAIAALGPRRGPGTPEILLRWAGFTLIATFALAVKPAPRYFEIPLLFVAALYSILLSRLPGKIQAASMVAWMIAGSLHLGFNYYRPALEGTVHEKTFHFLFMHDSSADALPKQRLAAELAARGCAFDQVRSDDIRISEPLRFLAIGDWPQPSRLTSIKTENCPDIVRVARGGDGQGFSVNP